LAAAAAVRVAGACTAGDHSEGPAAGDGLAAALPPTAGINVLIVSFDALRPDHLGIYGYQRPTSPHIDAFAAESVVFDRASSAAGSTPTSFAAAFTGRLPPRVFRGWELAEAPTLASVFAAAGFETAFFANNVQLVAERGFDRGFGHYRILVGEEAGEGGGGIADDEQVLAEAQAWLRERTRTPFLAWVHFLSPHSPYSHRPMAEHFYRTPAEGRFAISTGHTFAVDSSAELERVVDLYDGQVFFGDHLFESLLDTVREAGLLDRTLIVLTSDHGEELMEHGGLQHRTVFEEVLRIPLIIRHPGVRRGRRSDAPVSNLDLLPTLAAIAGLEVPGPTDGVSLLDPIDLETAEGVVVERVPARVPVEEPRGPIGVVVVTQGRPDALASGGIQDAKAPSERFRDGWGEEEASERVLHSWSPATFAAYEASRAPGRRDAFRARRVIRSG
jgi:arylsulfatase